MWWFVALMVWSAPQDRSEAVRVEVRQDCQTVLRAVAPWLVKHGVKKESIPPHRIGRMRWLMLEADTVRTAEGRRVGSLKRLAQDYGTGAQLLWFLREAEPHGWTGRLILAESATGGCEVEFGVRFLTEFYCEEAWRWNCSGPAIDSNGRFEREYVEAIVKAARQTP